MLTVTGLLFLVLSLAGVAFGVYMSTDPKTRDQGRLFAVWWVPAVAAASGVLMRDVVTFTVGVLCFLVAGAVFAFEGARPSKPPVRRRDDPSGEPPEDERRRDSEKTTKENRAGGYGRAAS